MVAATMDLTAGEALEQREEVVKSAEDASEAEVAAPAADENGDLANGHAAAETEPADATVKLYFVRLPKPDTSKLDAKLKQLQQEVQDQVKRIGAVSDKLQKERAKQRDLRQQRQQARSLKDESQPEWNAKNSRMRELRDLKKGYLDKISTIKGSIKGLECKSEEELDARIRELEERIAHGSLPLREEKQVVQQISKLNGQRSQIREYELHKASLEELEGETKKIKAVIGEMDGEFTIIKTERDAAQRILQEINDKLKPIDDVVKALEEEYKEAVDVKNKLRQEVDDLRAQNDQVMQPWRENRKLSLHVRTLVEAGQTDEARQVCDQQVDELVPKLCSDYSYRTQYQTMWSEQRKYIVSELLPQSSKVAPPPKAAASKGQAASKARAAPPEPRGKEKAAAIIERLLAETKAARARAAPVEDSDSGDADDEKAPEAPAPKPAAEPFRPTAPVMSAVSATAAVRSDFSPAQAAANVFNYKVEMPKVDEAEFVPPVIKEEVAISDAAAKEQLREEQRRKAAEAEAKKKKRAELAEKKRLQAVETAKRMEVERRERDRAAREAAAQSKAAAAAQQAAPAAQEPEAEAPAAVESTSSKPSSSVAQRSAPASLRRPAKSTASSGNQFMRVVKKAEKWANANTTAVAFLGFFIFVLVLLMLLFSA